MIRSLGCSVEPHSPAVTQDELGIGDFPYLGNIVILEPVFPFPEPCRNSNLISYTDLHGRGKKHVPLTLADGLNSRICPGLAIRLSHLPLLAGTKPSRVVVSIASKISESRELAGLE